MKELLERLKAAEEKADRADREYENDPENEEKEKAFDLAYNEEYKAFEELAKAIAKATAGEINTHTDSGSND